MIREIDMIDERGASSDPEEEEPVNLWALTTGDCETLRYQRHWPDFDMTGCYETCPYGVESQPLYVIIPRFSTLYRSIGKDGRLIMLSCSPFAGPGLLLLYPICYSLHHRDCVCSDTIHDSMRIKRHSLRVSANETADITFE